VHLTSYYSWVGQPEVGIGWVHHVSPFSLHLWAGLGTHGVETLEDWSMTLHALSYPVY
jgi:hypothetical protein